jgi:hypothetical protein
MGTCIGTMASRPPGARAILSRLFHSVPRRRGHWHGQDGEHRNREEKYVGQVTDTGVPLLV